ncbi:MAG: RagB/SusD family nutrient uptake outer membrane protein [Tannerella sp.]|nr:RagB/SusD family nutrient uptake outer membrane protein [Tannerella sp.]
MMKTIKYIIFSMVIMAASTVMTSCNDTRFLEQNPETFYTTDNIFSTSEQVDQVLVSIYSKIRYMWINIPISHDYFNFKEKGTDMLDITYSKRGQSFSDYGLINADHETFRVLYSDFYTIIARANLAIYAAELPQISWGSASDKAYALAQARFFRAFAYKNLGELWGGVPIVTEPVSEPRFDFVRTTRVETYQFAIDEMEAVLNDLPETTAHGGRIVRAAAQHNLSELYLAKGIQLEAEGNAGNAQADYAKSIQYAGQVIDGGTYGLMTDRFGTRASEDRIIIGIHPNGEAARPVVDTIMFETNLYWDLFQTGNVDYQDGNRECIWAVQVDFQAFKTEDPESKLPYSQCYSPVLRDGSNNRIRSWLEDIGGFPNSHTTQNDYVRDSIWEGKFAADLRNSQIVRRRRFKGNMEDSPYYLKEIPWDIIWWIEGISEATAMNQRNMCFPLSCKTTTDQYQGLEDVNQYYQNLFRDDYIIRLPETILLRAEAKQRAGDKAGAANDINMLRSRSKCEYLVTATDVDDNFNLILDERARELLYEECRWNTLLRMGGTVAVDRIRKYSYWPETKATLNFNYNLWPVPQSVIDVNKEVPMAQNPGWENR